jgi:hypothetical protein
MSLHICIFSISSPYEPIHHQDPSEEAMTSAHRLEANSNYAYGGYLAGAEPSPHLRNQSCTFLQSTPLLSLVVLYLCLMIWSYIDSDVGGLIWQGLLAADAALWPLL